MEGTEGDEDEVFVDSSAAMSCKSGTRNDSVCLCVCVCLYVCLRVFAVVFLFHVVHISTETCVEELRRVGR